jgi:peptidoglycan/LPS O-acetylase OafA/YrhL
MENTVGASSRRIPQLDAIRGLAILVVIFHNQRDQFPALHLQRVFADGWMGVDLFFVLSGFLITGILLDSKGSAEYFKDFYARRCLRIWPLYYALLAFMFVAVPMLRGSERHVVFERSSPWWAYPLFLQNFLVAVPTNAKGALGVTWSLAVEEQFYLVWPWVIRYCSRARLRQIALWVVCLSPALRLGLTFEHVVIYSNLFCRLDGLMLGALLALAVRSPEFVAAKYLRLAWACLVTMLPLAFVTEALGARWLTFSLSAVASAALVYLALFSTQEWFRRIFTNRFMVFTGTISYGLYLLHKIPFDAAQAFHLDSYAWLMMPVLLLACYALATLSWKILEQPFLRLKKFFVPPPVLLESASQRVALVR